MAHVVGLSKAKPVIVTSDFNVAHTSFDVHRSEVNISAPQDFEVAGFSQLERNSFDSLLRSGFVDVFRPMNPKIQAFTSRQSERKRNLDIGWRLNYFLISADHNWQVSTCEIQDQQFGSDHCPVKIRIKV